MKKMVVMMDVYDERSKGRIIRTVSRFPGITTITMDSKDGKLTVIGEFDITKILTKLERRWRNAKMATFGPYDPKKEAETAAAAAEKKKKEDAETAAAAEKKKKGESERRGFEAHREIHCFYDPPMHHQSSAVYDHDHGCIIS